MTLPCEGASGDGGKASGSFSHRQWRVFHDRTSSTAAITQRDYQTLQKCGGTAKFAGAIAYLHAVKDHTVISFARGGKPWNCRCAAACEAAALIIS